MWKGQFLKTTLLREAPLLSILKLQQGLQALIDSLAKRLHAAGTRAEGKLTSPFRCLTPTPHSQLDTRVWVVQLVVFCPRPLHACAISWSSVESLGKPAMLDIPTMCGHIFVASSDLFLSKLFLGMSLNNLPNQLGTLNSPVPLGDGAPYLILFQANHYQIPRSFTLLEPRLLLVSKLLLRFFCIRSVNYLEVVP